jgi:hypothetical protein
MDKILEYDSKTDTFYVKFELIDWSRDEIMTGWGDIPCTERAWDKLVQIEAEELREEIRKEKEEPK